MTPTDTLEPLAAAWVKEVTGEEIWTVSALASSKHWKKVEKAIDEGIKSANDNAVSNVAKVKKWRLIVKEFSVDGGELSPSLKLKRFHIAEMYKNEIDSMYK